ncbi:MAG: penicillin-binding transpeptidase domain-containing protein [Desulfatiglandales bacterium]|nr:penicillin-binding transpeptidase domain-containing protein [Desulfatiglandales bacterium]
MARRKKFIKTISPFKVYLVLVIIVFTCSWLYAHLDPPGQETLRSRDWNDIRSEMLVKQDLPALLKILNLKLTPLTKSYHLVTVGKKLTVETSHNTALQGYIINLLRRSRSSQAAVVVMRPDNGQILAMVNYEKYGTGEGKNLCLTASFPAASLFKIISAAAAIETRGFVPDKTLLFRGMRHTLYKSQLKRGKQRYARKTSLREAFSRSINPVFGKIGIYDLGRERINEYADKFLFNHEIPFDLPLSMSSTLIPEDDFGLAEIASGFNRRTRISPLHASLITASIANKGHMFEPWIVRRIKDESGKVLYRVRESKLARPIEEDTAQKLRTLMEDTVLQGTARKAFRPLRRKKVFRDIALGAKTGTINDSLDQYKYDWLTAYALPNHGDRGITITVLAIHGEKLGIRSKDLARYIINYHFTS